MAVEKVVNINVNDNIDDVESKVNDLNKTLDKTEETVKDTTKASEELGKTTDAVTGGMIGKFKGLLSSVKSVISSFGVLKTAIIATGLGALLIAIVSVKQAFTSSEEGQNRYAKLLSNIGVVVGNVTDILSNLGNSIISLSKAIGLVLVGDIDGAKEAFKEFKKEIFEVKDAVANFGEETSKEIKRASEIADARAKADKLERKLIVERAESDRKRAELLEKSQQRQNFSVKERIEFLKEASELEDAITKKEIEVAKLRSDALIEENKLSNSTKEDLIAEEEAKARLIQLETARLSKQKEVTGQISGLIEQEKALNKAVFDEKQRLINEDLLNQQKANEESLKLAREKAEKEREIADAQYDLLQELRNTDQEQEIFNLIKQFDKKFELANGNFELEKELEIAQKEEIAAINQKYIDANLKAEEDARLKEKEANDKRIADDRAVLDSKYKMTNDTINALIGLNDLFSAKNEKDARRQFKINKALSLAQASIQTFQAVTGALTAGGNPIKLATGAQFVEAGIAAAIGGANIAKIAGTQFDSGSVPSDGGGGGGTPPNISSPQNRPSFNIVGGGGTNQLKELESAPIKAYVVSGDVSSAQSLDRNRQQNATF